MSNSDTFTSIGWILNNSTDGFFIIASEKGQQEVVNHYLDSNVSVFDYLPVHLTSPRIRHRSLKRGATRIL